MTLRTIFKREYQAWMKAIARCHQPTNDSYSRYSANDITVNEEWRGHDGFFRFLDHIGPCPTDDYMLDRIDGSKGYGKGNVRWVTRLEQNRNRSGVTTPADVLDEIIRVSEETGISPSTLRYRWQRKGSIDTTPPKPVRNRKAEQRRARAVEMLEAGWTQRAIAKELGVTEQAVRLMRDRAIKDGWRR